MKKTGFNPNENVEKSLVKKKKTTLDLTNKGLWDVFVSVIVPFLDEDDILQCRLVGRPWMRAVALCYPGGKIRPVKRAWGLC
jgi:hypothetical protein